MTLSLPRALFAACPKGLEPLLADELRAFGATTVSPRAAGVHFEGSIETAYRACLWSRLASRVLLLIKRAPAASAEALYEVCLDIPWEEHLDAGGTLAVEATLTHSGFTHPHFVALKVKDAIVDRLRDRSGHRPSIDTHAPDLRIHVHARNEDVHISVDLSGESLHKRGYRMDGAEAPLKENLAAALLLRARWPEIAAGGGRLTDPMCGSGSFLIEGAFIAADMAPGLGRARFGFERWRQHDTATWNRLRSEAEARQATGLPRLPPIAGYDPSAETLRAARDNIENAGLAEHIVIARRALKDTPDTPGPGLVICNPPYGVRLGTPESNVALYRELGEILKTRFQGSQAAVFASEDAPLKELGLRHRYTHSFYNGAIACRLLRFDLTPESTEPPAAPTVPPVLAPGAQMFANRLTKNLRETGKWARREGIHCFRLYDADLPEYNFAVDLYTVAGADLGDGTDPRAHVHAHVQEYEAPGEIEGAKVRARRHEALTALPIALDIPRRHVHYKLRQRQKGHGQYHKLDEQRHFLEVEEHGCRLWVNLDDYLDTGLFLDHRPTRRLIQELARGQRFLNLFGYTGAATVHAAIGGAKSTTTVDMSNTYLDWARRNLALNGIGETRHHLVQADVLAWITTGAQPRYDLIFLDPPTYSRSKRMQEDFDVQRDHAALLQETLRWLAPGGLLLFSTNLRSFTLDATALGDLAILDITRETIPRDFARNPKIHRCFRIRQDGQRQDGP